jgi:hypothetical protein
LKVNFRLAVSQVFISFNMITSRLLVRILAKNYSTKPKLTVCLNDTVLQDVKDEKLKPKHHPGKIPKIRDKDLPQQIVTAISKAVKGNHQSPISQIYWF